MKSSNMFMGILGVLVVAVLILSVGTFLNSNKTATIVVTNTGGGGGGGITDTGLTTSCDQYAPVGFFSAKNPDNASTEYVAQTIAILAKQSDGTFKKVGNVSTLGGTTESFVQTAANVLVCGTTYRLAAIPNTNAGSYITKASISDGNDAVGANGYVEFTLRKSSIQVSLEIPKHGALTAKLYDADSKVFSYSNVTGACAATSGSIGWGSYEPTGATFEGTSNCTAGSTMGIGSFMNLELSLKTGDSVQFGDFGYLVLVDASTGDYKVPSATLASSGLTDIKNKGVLTPGETAAYSAYEYAYYVTPEMMTADARLKLGNSPVVLSFYMEPLGGVNPSNDVVLALSARGNFESVSGGVINVGAVQDNSARTQVHTLQSWTYDVV